VREWARIADETNCAVELVQHMRKGGGQGEPTAEDARGASAFVDGVRSTRVLIPMSREEASQAGVDNRRRFFRLVAGKANMALHGEGESRELVDIELPNGRAGAGDRVQAVGAWRMPDASDQVSDADLETIKVKIRAGAWRADARAKDWVGIPVAEVLEFDLKDACARKAVSAAVDSWLQRGALVRVEKRDAQRKPRTYVEAP